MQFSSEKLIQITKKKVNRLAKTTMAGPGKFGVLIFICLIIVGFYENFNKIEKINLGFSRVSFTGNSQKIINIFPNTLKEKKDEKINMMNIIKKNQYYVEKIQNDQELDILFEIAMDQDKKENYIPEIFI